MRASCIVSCLLSVPLHFSVTPVNFSPFRQYYTWRSQRCTWKLFFCTIIILISCIFSVECPDQQRAQRLFNRFRPLAHSSRVRRNFILELDCRWCIEVESTWASAGGRWARRRRRRWKKQRERPCVDIWVRRLFLWVRYAPGKSYFHQYCRGLHPIDDLFHRPSQERSHSAKQKTTSESLLINTRVFSPDVQAELRISIGTLCWSVVLVTRVRDRLSVRCKSLWKGLKRCSLTILLQRKNYNCCLQWRWSLCDITGLVLLNPRLECGTGGRKQLVGNVARMQ